MSFLADKPCGNCGWKYKTFHICCLDYNDPSIYKQHPVSGRRGGAHRVGPHSDLSRAAMSMAQTERWGRVHAQQEARTAEVIELWNEGYGPYSISAKIDGLTVHSATRLLKRLGEQGKINYVSGRRKTVNASG